MHPAPLQKRTALGLRGPESLVFLFLVLAFALQPFAAWGETRTLKMYFGHSKESATITFKRNGRYVASGLRKANRFLRDWRRNEPTKMDPELLDLVWEVYQASGSRKPIQIISGYRSPRTNNMLRRRGRKVAKTSQHTRGKALDFFMPDVSVKKLRALGLKAHRGGVGYYRGSFVHLDTGRVRHWPRMSRRQLSSVFPRGRTIHVPSDGKPLRGYKTAMANLKKGLNANGSKRTTTVRRSLIARIFSPSGNDGDENESRTRAAPKRQPAPKPQATRQVAAATTPTRSRPRGVDPFSRDSTAVSKSGQGDAEELKVADFVPKRVPVPRLRPAARPAPAVETQLALATPEVDPTIKPENKTANNEAVSVAGAQEATTLALATPNVAELSSAVEQSLRPRLDLNKNQEQPIESTPQVASRTDQNIESLKSRITNAFENNRKQPVAEKPSESLNQAVLLAALSKLPTPKSAKVQRNALRPSPDESGQNSTIADRLSVPVPRMRTVLEQATSLQARLDAQASGDAATLPSWRVGGDSGAKNNDLVLAAVPTPRAASKSVPQQRPEPSGERLTPSPAELKLGDLDGGSVKAWAVAHSTRVGPAAVLSAPVYSQSTKRAAPASVYSAGFAFQRAPLRADRFSGRALTRVAFAYFDN